MARTAEPDTFKPSRRVREAPGGKHTDIFDFSEVTGDALSLAPPPPEGGVGLLISLFKGFLTD